MQRCVVTRTGRIDYCVASRPAFQTALNAQSVAMSIEEAGTNSYGTGSCRKQARDVERQRSERRI